MDFAKKTKSMLRRSWRLSSQRSTYWKSFLKYTISSVSNQSDAERVRFEKRLWKLSKSGDNGQCLSVFEEMKKERVELSHFALSSMLHCCLKSKNQNGSVSDSMALYASIWSEFVEDHGVCPDAGCYGLAVKAASECLHSENVVRFGQEMKERFIGELDVRKWNGLIAAFGRLGDIERMFGEFEAMKRSGVQPDRYSISIVINGLISNQNDVAMIWRLDRFELLLNEILTESPSSNKLIDVYVFGGILNGLIQSGKSERVPVIWKQIVEEMGVTPNALCYALRIMAAAQCLDGQTVDTVVAELRASDLKMNRFCFHQILTAYGRLGAFDKMWTEYDRWRCTDSVDIGALSILSALEQRKEHRRRALDEAIRCIPDWSVLHRDRKKHFYRMSCIADHVELQSVLWPLLEISKSDKDEGGDVVPLEVEAQCVIEGKRYVLGNGHRPHRSEEDKEQLLYNEMTEHLIQTVGHQVDTAKHPEIRTLDPLDQHLSDQHALKILSFHAEKRTLALCLQKEEDQSKDIVISVSMRMCSDCHRFFCSVSRHFPQRNIMCIDPTKTHRFNKGTCSCGRT